MTSPVAVITGGDGDLAREIDRALRESGFHVSSPGRDRLDVRHATSVDGFFSGLERIDLLVNNAGITMDGPFARMSESDWDAAVDTNLRGAFLCSRAALRLMTRARSGHIVHVGSYSALRPPPGQANYAAAKAGLTGLTKSLAAEYGPRNIRVNCVLPGFLETRMTASLQEKAIAAARDRHVLGRFNTVTDAARFIAFLDGMAHVSGQVFQLDSRA